MKFYLLHFVSTEILMWILTFHVEALFNSLDRYVSFRTFMIDRVCIFGARCHVHTFKAIPDNIHFGVLKNSYIQIGQICTSIVDIEDGNKWETNFAQLFLVWTCEFNIFAICLLVFEYLTLPPFNVFRGPNNGVCYETGGSFKHWGNIIYLC